MRYYIIIFLKGMAMGIANVIPGVSGGTIALITGIYEELINSLKSFNRKALKLVFSLNLSAFAQQTNLIFILAIFTGSIISVFSIANLFKFLFNHYPILIWSFFFGLILASVYFVGKRIHKWNKHSIISLLIGTVIALSFSFITPSNENNNLLYVFLCGIIGVSGMILPGLSGSFILILMGNYELLMVTAVAELNITLLTIFFMGSLFGLMSFSHLLSWLLNNHKDPTLALLTGFIVGSLSSIWPWKVISESIILNGKEQVLKYDWYLPTNLNQETCIAILLIIIGVLVVYALETFSIKKDK